MPKPKRQQEAPGERSAPKPTELVRVEADLARKLNIISQAFNQNIADIISPHLRPFIEREYAKAVKRLAEDVKDAD